MSDELQWLEKGIDTCQVRVRMRDPASDEALGSGWDEQGPLGGDEAARLHVPRPVAVAGLLQEERWPKRSTLPFPIRPSVDGRTSLPSEACTRQAVVAEALRELAREVESSLHLGVSIPDEALGSWAEHVEVEIEESTTAVLLAARALRRVTG